MGRKRSWLVRKQQGTGLRAGDTAELVLQPDLEDRPAELPEQRERAEADGNRILKVS